MDVQLDVKVPAADALNVADRPTSCSNRTTGIWKFRGGIELPVLAESISNRSRAEGQLCGAIR